MNGKRPPFCATIRSRPRSLPAALLLGGFRLCGRSGRNAQASGVGLGLSIVRDIVLAMRRHVAIENAAGKGTTVSI